MDAEDKRFILKASIVFTMLIPSFIFGRILAEPSDLSYALPLLIFLGLIVSFALMTLHKL